MGHRLKWGSLIAWIFIVYLVPTHAQSQIVQDAEYYVLAAQNSQKWALENRELDKKLAELRKKHGQPPNLIHIMWDDTPYGDVGIPAIQKIRGPRNAKPE